MINVIYTCMQLGLSHLMPVGGSKQGTWYIDTFAPRIITNFYAANRTVVKVNLSSFIIQGFKTLFSSYIYIYLKH